MSGKKRCMITGVNERLYRKAVKQWTRERKRFGLPTLSQPKKPSAAIRSALSFVASLPPPPTSQHYHCMQQWYQCYTEASYLDSYREMLASIEYQMTQGEINLTAYLESYAACIGGSPA